MVSRICCTGGRTPRGAGRPRRRAGVGVAARARCRLDRIDLFILHQALPGDFDRTLAAYRALEQLLADGKVRAIGVSNFMVDHLRGAADATEVVPAVNQIEVHPFFAA